MPDNYVYVLNSDKTHSEALNYTYANRKDAFPDVAFAETSVNPVLKNPGLSVNGENSANFFEIRNAPTSFGVTSEPNISANANNRIVNRIIPSNSPNTLANYATNKQQTNSYKLRVYDPNATVTGQLVSNVGGAQSIDLDTNDYFVLINPEIKGDDGALAIRPHFAKIKQLTTFDYYGDGIEFEPKYPSSIPKGTKFEIYQGPAKTDVNVVAVSYGLRGLTDATSGRTVINDKYDVSSTVSRPTWYFYEDRLVTKNQLDYNTKYQLTTCRWYKDWEQVNTVLSTTSSAISRYTENCEVFNSHTFSSSDVGRSLWIGSNKDFLGVITDENSGTNEITLDANRVEVNGGLGTALPIYQGRDLHQSVFLTEQEYGNRISDLGGLRGVAFLIDNIRTPQPSSVAYGDGVFNTKDYDTGATYTFTPDRWDKAIRNYKRNTSDRTSAHTSFYPANYGKFHGELTGAKRHLYYKSSHLKNNIVDPIMDASVNYPRNKMSQIARIKVLDYSGIQFLKLRKNDRLVIRNSIHTGQLGKYKIPYSVSSVSSGGTHKIKINNITESYDVRNDNFIKINDIIQVNDFYYIVSGIGAPADINDARAQEITVNKSKKDRDLKFSGISSMASFTNVDMYVRSWNGGLAGTFPIDTEVVYSSNAYDRLTINNETINKTKSSLNDNRLVLLSPELVNHEIKIDYGDSVHNQIKLSSDFTSKKYYQTTPISMVYYLSGNYAIDEEIFSGSIEDIYSVNKNGMISYEISGRDKLSKLLGDTTTKNLNHTDDVIYSSLIPVLSDTVDVTTIGILGSDSKTVNLKVTDDTIVPKPFDIILNSDGDLVGEILSISSTSVETGYKDYTIILSCENITETQIDGNSIVKLWQPRTSNYQSSFKALSKNPQAASSPTDLDSTGDKGVVFVDGKRVIYSDTNAVTYDNLAYTSATGGYGQDASLGYDILDVDSIGTKDSKFSFRLGLERDSKTVFSSVVSPSITTGFSMIDKVKMEGEPTTITLAPTFPIVLGSIETNTSDTRFSNENNAYLYLVNRNIPSGGFIHRLKHKHDVIYTSSQMYRYLDLQHISEGEIKQTYDSVLNEGLRPQKIIGAAPAYCIKATGATNALISTLTDLPILGSNYHDANYTGTDKLVNIPKEFPITRAGTNSSTKAFGLSQKDYRTKKYELLSVGDLFPESKLRYNNLLNQSDFSSFGLLSEANPQKGNLVEHTNYTGGSFELLRKENSYDMAKIDSASIAPTDVKRWGVMRLVEATFDWHFNPVDGESLKDSSSISIENFAYPRFKTPNVLTPHFTTHSQSITFTGTNTHTFKKDDMIYKTDGTLVARFNADTTINASSRTINTDITIFVTSDINTAIGGFVSNIQVWDMLADDGFGLDSLSNNNPMRHLNVYLLSGEINKSYLESVPRIGNNNLFHSHNIYLPIIAKAFQAGSGSDNDNFTNSPFHEEGDWDGVDYTAKYWHLSRVINALQMPTFSATNNSDTQYNAARGTDLYQNCVAVFKHFKGSIQESQGSNERNISLTSSLLGLDGNTRFLARRSNLSNSGTNDIDRDQQHSRNMRISKISVSGDAGAAFVGTKTASRSGVSAFIEPFESTEGYSVDGKEQNHLDAAVTTGEIYQAQMLIKPQINTAGVSASDNMLITMHSTNPHNWINYVPNLEGYYLTKQDGSSTLKIISHVASTGSSEGITVNVHTLKFNANIETNSIYRLMKISETTFEDTPDFIEINKLINTGLQYDTIPKNIRTADIDSSNTDDYAEGIKAMYILLETDKAITTTNNLPEKLTVANANAMFTDGEIIDCYITDGKNTQRKTLSVTKNDTTLRFDYDGKLTGNGVVSFGKTFNITTTNSLDVKDTAYIGSSFSIGTDAEKAIEEILEDNGIDLDSSERNLTYTGAIVASDTSGLTISLSDAVSSIAVGDVLYNHEGKLIGEVASGHNTTTLVLKDVDYDNDDLDGDGNETPVVDIFYRPKENEELVKYSRKPFILNTRFAENDVFTAVNFLASKKGLEYVFDKDKIVIRDIDDYTSRRRYSLRYKDGQNLLSVENNSSLFDEATKVIVIGDNVKAISEIPTTGNTNVIKHIDSNIKYVKEAQIKAEQLLALHNTPAIKVTIEIERSGDMKLMKPGDLITLNFPNHGIPPDDYIIFEIENAMSNISKIQIGTFNKTIAERLAEMNIEREGGFVTLFNKSVSVSTSNKAAFVQLGLEETSLHYSISSVVGTDIGWSTVIGWTTLFNPGTETTTTEVIKL